VALYNILTTDVRSSPSTGKVRYRSPSSGLEYQCPKTNQSLVGASEVHLMAPLPSPSIGARCLRSVSGSMIEDWSGHKPQSRTVTCSSEEAKWSCWVTYVALGNGCEQYTDATSHHFSLINVRVSRSMAGTCWRSNFFVHCSNTLTLTLPPLFHYFHLREPSLSILRKKRSLLFLPKLKPSNLNTQKVWFLFTDDFAIHDFVAHNMLLTAWDCL